MLRMGLTVAFIAGCQGLPKNVPAPALENSPEVPKTTQGGPRIVVPATMLQLGRVIRERAEMREGPGGRFPLVDLLSRGDRLLLFQRVGVWLRVVSRKGDVAGWVHHRTVAKQRGGGEPVSVHEARLPVVFAVRPIRAIETFDRRHLKGQNIRKGQLFRALKVESKRTLVWLPQLKSSAWLASQDAH